jgi:uncharacterized membrane protein (DUF485 family)
MKLVFLANKYCDTANYIPGEEGVILLSVMKRLQYVTIFALVRFSEAQNSCKKNTLLWLHCFFVLIVYMSLVVFMRFHFNHIDIHVSCKSIITFFWSVYIFQTCTHHVQFHHEQNYGYAVTEG